MKRTFTVTVEGEDARKRWFDADTIREHVEGWTDTVVTVTEITAVHAKERELVGAAIAYAKARAEYDADDSSGSDFAMVGMLVDAQGVMELKARELRALMEGKPNG